MHIIFRLVGFSVISELQSIYGRSDLTLSNSSAVYLIELKMDHGREPEACYNESFEQIRKKGYVIRYLASGKNVRVFTLLFSCEGKGVVGYRDDIRSKLIISRLTAWMCIQCSLCISMIVFSRMGIRLYAQQFLSRYEMKTFIRSSHFNGRFREA